MAVWSEIPFSQATQEGRFGPEFWMPAYLDPLKKDRNWHLIGNLLSTVQYGISREMNDEGKGVPIYRMNEMDDLFLATPEKYVQLDPKEFNIWKLSPGDVLFNRTNSYRFVGRTGILKEPLQAIFASYLIRLVPDSTKLLPEYLTVYLNTPTGIAQVKRRAMESINQTNVSGSEIRKVPIPLFPIPFQKTIVQLVNQAATKRIDARQGYIQAQTALLSHIGIPQLHLSHTLFYERPISEIQDPNRIDAEFYQPKHQILARALQATGKSSPLGRLVSHCSRGLQPEYADDGDIPVVTTKHMSSQFLTTDLDACTVEAWESRKKAQLQEHDVLFYSTGANIGRTNCWFRSDRAMGSNHVTIIRTTPDCNPVYLSLFLNSTPGLMQTDQHAHGSAQREIYPEDLRRFQVWLPEPKVQQEFADMVLQAYSAMTESKALLAQAKATVEKAILGDP